ncbi:apolipoprotein N-acyltransferase [Marilutibacter alkalisoli]|uniref:Apolipoprotein N-acyltransferase n=1 Tax=Marilutibacter alkalisoli TaxID=2591633 RepID=A0A514BWW5_9GAMM|nr:apolipoprotein N-acyltransferase [Lysobacter alkalisoli]QDH71894.1 apolipoprotein N-acyltransferase [Lysobacter alkalisoli]
MGPRWSRLAGIVASAALLGLYARGGHAWLLGFVVLLPWLLALNRERTQAGALLSGLLMSVAFMAAVFIWFGAAIGAYTGVGALPATLVLLVLAPLLQCQVLAFALVRHLVGRRHGPLLRALAGASAWVGCEWLVPKLLGDTLGHGLFPSAYLRQVADLGGAAGITFLLILVNEALALIAVRWREGGARAMLRPAALAAAIVVAMAGYGGARLSALQSPPAADVPSLRVAMVQASITDYERLREEIGAYGVVRHVLDTHYALSNSAIRDHDADVLLWSETVYPTTFGHPKSEDGAALDREILDFVDSVGVPLVFGTYDIDDAGEYNAAAFVEPGRGLLGHYRKAHPFPLTEHVPGWLDGPLLRRLLPWTGGWQPGDGARVLPLRTTDGREVNVVPLICLDDVRTGLAIDGARLGAQAIIGLSNDSWFTRYPNGARLHLTVAAFRSIETRLPQLRVTTNGLSAIIDDTGEVRVSTTMGDPAVLTGTLAAQDPPVTLMVRWGDWVGRTGLLFLLVLAVFAGWRAVSGRRAGMDTVTQGGDAHFSAEVAVLPAAWRAVAALLRLCAGVGLLALALGMLLRHGAQVQSLSQIWLFAAMVVAPMLAAWAIRRAFAATARIEAGMLVLDQRAQRVEIPVGQITGLRAWRVPLPDSGVDLQLASGRRWPLGIILPDPRALQRALAAAGSPARMAGGASDRMAALAQVRASIRRRWFEHALVKFALFPLLPALVAFRLHQHIAFGGTFGEYYIYGPKAWLLGLLIWWTAWSIGLMLFAAALRIVIEAVTGFVLLLRPAAASDARRALEWLGRLVFYVGVPAWLLLRILSA